MIDVLSSFRIFSSITMSFEVEIVLLFQDLPFKTNLGIIDILNDFQNKHILHKGGRDNTVNPKVEIPSNVSFSITLSEIILAFFITTPSTQPQQQKQNKANQSVPHRKF